MRGPDGLRGTRHGLIRVAHQPQAECAKAQAGHGWITPESVAHGAVALAVVAADGLLHVRVGLNQVTGAQQGQAEQFVATDEQIDLLAPLGQLQQLFTHRPGLPQVAPIDVHQA